jgi:hypothetical protein
MSQSQIAGRGTIDHNQVIPSAEASERGPTYGPACDAETARDSISAKSIKGCISHRIGFMSAIYFDLPGKRFCQGSRVRRRWCQLKPCRSVQEPSTSLPREATMVSSTSTRKPMVRVGTGDAPPRIAKHILGVQMSTGAPPSGKHVPQVRTGSGEAPPRLLKHKPRVRMGDGAAPPRLLKHLG